MLWSQMNHLTEMAILRMQNMFKLMDLFSYFQFYAQNFNFIESKNLLSR